jgi:hypothetical protein
MPTMFGLLNWSHETLGYGHDLLAPSAAEIPGRAFVSNYQNLGLLTRDGLAILGPNRKTAAYTCDFETGDLSPPSPATGPLIHDTTVFYQSASWLFKSGRLRKDFRNTSPLAFVPNQNPLPSIPTPAKPES